MGFGCKLVVRAFHNGIDGTCLLTEPAINALGHINVVSGGPTGAVFAGFGLDRNGLGGTYRLAKLAGDATLVSRGVSPQRVFPTKAWAQVAPLERVVDGDLWLETDLQGEGQPTNDFRQEKNLGGPVKDGFP